MSAGAHPQDWQRLIDLGLTEDLLPVVSDTSLPIDPESKMKAVGKTPSRINREGNVTGIAKWTQQLSTYRQVMDWAKDDRLGICLQTRVVRAIDVDVDDPEVSAAIRELAVAMLGELPCRWRRNSGKLLLAFSMPGDYTKRIVQTDSGAVEFLATGQQFIAHGTHTSGVRYEWEGLDACEVLGGFPEVLPEGFEAFWSGLADVYGASVEVRSGVQPTVARKRADITDPVVDYLDDHGWLREMTGEGVVHVTCPWKDEHTSDSGPSETSWFPAGVGGFSQGHFKCLHSHCAGRGDSEFLDAIGYLASQFEVVVPEPEAGEPEQLPVFKRDKQGRIEHTMDNVVMALGRPDICGVQLGYDEFKGNVMVGRGDRWRALRDVDYTDLRTALERFGFKAVSKESVRDACAKVADTNAFDSAIVWAQSLRWDGVHRVSSFFSDHFGMAPTDYTRAVGEYLWSALAGRVLEPGVKADMVPVLISGQGTRKTSMVEALAPIDDAFVELNLETRDDNLARSMRGKLVGELAELRGLRTRDAEAIKAWITRRVEAWTPKYQEHETRFPRRLVLIGTGNTDEFLDDETGERRWLPLRVGSVDVEAIKRDRDQLWAEGCEMFRRAGVHWQEAQRLAEVEHLDFKVQDPWHGHIAAWLAADGMDGHEGPARGAGEVKVADIAIGALRMDVRNVARKDEQRIVKVLRALGYEKRQVRRGDTRTKVWAPTEACNFLQVAVGTPKMG